MTTMEILKYLQQEIHTTIVATVNESGCPVTCAIDIMDVDDYGLYFLTAKGKAFYNRLKKCNSIALTGIKGNDTMSCVSVSICGSAKELGSDRLSQLFQKNPYMKEIYPTAESQKALTVFRIFAGTGEWFDLSRRPIERCSFAFGNVEEKQTGYYITDLCNGCKQCSAVCPQNCIDFTAIPATIQKNHCLHCGNCMEICPQHAVIQEELR